MPIVGLVVDTPLQIGDVTFLPFEANLSSFDNLFTSTLEQFSPDRDCIATTRVSAEWIKSAEIAREKIEKNLNILNFVGSLVWWDRPVGHINLAGRELERVSYTLVVELGTGVVTGRMGHTKSTPMPFRVDDEFLKFANFYGLGYIQSLINRKAFPIEEDYLQLFNGMDMQLKSWIK